MCNTIPGYDVINLTLFEINLIFLIKPILYRTKMSRQKFEQSKLKFEKGRSSKVK